MKFKISFLRHTTTRCAMRIGFGYLPFLTPFRNVLREIGKIGGLGGMDNLSPMISRNFINSGILSIFVPSVVIFLVFLMQSNLRAFYDVCNNFLKTKIIG